MENVLDSSAAERIVLRDVSWNTYECLLEDFHDRSSPRIAYSLGALEIMSPTPRHEMWNRNLAQLISHVAVEWRINARDLGGTTLKRPDLESGFEPDSCFYIQNSAVIGTPDRIDLQAGAPPPDLVIEVEVTNPSLPKLPLFARMGIPEVWRVNSLGSVTFLALKDGEYVRIEQSLALPLLTSDSVHELLVESLSMSPLDWLLHVRKWAQGRKSAA